MGMKFAVIDTETTWNDEVMSIGIVVSDFSKYEIIDKMYYVISPTYKNGGMYSSQLSESRGTKINIISRKFAIDRIKERLLKNGVKTIFAYNAAFDYRHLPELNMFIWIDIMKIAAYKQYNDKLPKTADYCTTGRLRSNFGVESMYTFLSGKKYYEIHNAICDAEDELQIIKMLDKNFEDYLIGTINSDELIDYYNRKIKNKNNAKTTKNNSSNNSDKNCDNVIDIDKLSLCYISL